MESKKVLIASARKHADSIAAAIPGGFDIIHASTFESALKQVKCGIDVLVCDVGFNELQIRSASMHETPSLSGNFYLRALWRHQT